MLRSSVLERQSPGFIQQSAYSSCWAPSQLTSKFDFWPPHLYTHADEHTCQKNKENEKEEERKEEEGEEMKEECRGRLEVRERQGRIRRKGEEEQREGEGKEEDTRIPSLNWTAFKPPVSQKPSNLTTSYLLNKILNSQNRAQLVGDWHKQQHFHIHWMPGMWWTDLRIPPLSQRTLPRLLSGPLALDSRSFCKKQWQSYCVHNPS